MPALASTPSRAHVAGDVTATSLDLAPLRAADTTRTEMGAEWPQEYLEGYRGDFLDELEAELQRARIDAARRIDRVEALAALPHGR